jgi:SAM-dependent methyltransferase
VVEIGCGAGRLLGYLSEISEQAEGIDVSSSMVQYCRSNFPAARVALGDLRSLDASLEGSFDVVLASDNILDILDDSARRSVLEEIRERHLAPAGLLVFSTHNLAFMDAAAVSHPGPSPPSANGGGNVSRAIRLSRKALSRSPTEAVRGVARLRREKANRRRLGALEYRAGDHAVLNDVAHEFGLLHYYIRRDDQQRQLEQLGFELCECLELDGGVVPAGRDGVGPSLYYVASAR